MLSVLMQTENDANTTDSANLIGITEAARRLGVSDVTIRRRILDGILPAVMIANRYRIRPEDLDVLMKRVAA